MDSDFGVDWIGLYVATDYRRVSRACCSILIEAEHWARWPAVSCGSLSQHCLGKKSHTPRLKGKSRRGHFW